MIHVRADPVKNSKSAVVVKPLKKERKLFF